VRPLPFIHNTYPPISAAYVESCDLL
jgi:hypothetical protein